jgi:hypothetical protein
MQLISLFLKRLAQDIGETTNVTYWKEKIKDKYGLTALIGPGVHGAHWILREIYSILSPVPEKLVRDCGFKYIILRDLGLSKSFYPNHGYFMAQNHSITLNADIFYHPDQPDDFFDHHGYFLSRASQTIYHEAGHGFDAQHGDLSEKDAWMKLSGWSKEPGPGLKRLIINEPGAPKVVGEYYFDPKSEYHGGGFTRFYGKRNPWDDLADCFSMYIGGLKENVPATKRAYLDNLLKKYY